MQKVSHIIEDETNEKVASFLNESQINITKTVSRLASNIQKSAESIVGNCYVLPFVYDKAYWSICQHGLTIIVQHFNYDQFKFIT